MSDKIAIAAQECLRASSYSGLRSLTCESSEGRLLLRGRVSSYYIKQLAQEAVRHFSDVQVINAVQVVSRNG